MGGGCRREVAYVISELLRAPHSTVVIYGDVGKQICRYALVVLNRISKMELFSVEKNTSFYLEMITHILPFKK